MRPDRLMTLEEVAEYLQVSSKTVYQMAQKRRLPCFKVGRQWRFRMDQLEDWLMTDAYQAPEEKNEAG